MAHGTTAAVMYKLASSATAPCVPRRCSPMPRKLAMTFAVINAGTWPRCSISAAINGLASTAVPNVMTPMYVKTPSRTCVRRNATSTQSPNSERRGEALHTFGIAVPKEAVASAHSGRRHGSLNDIASNGVPETGVRCQVSGMVRNQARASRYQAARGILPWRPGSRSAAVVSRPSASRYAASWTITCVAPSCLSTASRQVRVAWHLGERQRSRGRSATGRIHCSRSGSDASARSSNTSRGRRSQSGRGQLREHDIRRQPIHDLVDLRRSIRRV